METIIARLVVEQVVTLSSWLAVAVLMLLAVMTPVIIFHVATLRQRGRMNEAIKQLLSVLSAAMVAVMLTGALVASTEVPPERYPEVRRYAAGVGGEAVTQLRGKLLHFGRITWQDVWLLETMAQLHRQHTAAQRFGERRVMLFEAATN